LSVRVIQVYLLAPHLRRTSQQKPIRITSALAVNERNSKVQPYARDERLTQDSRATYTHVHEFSRIFFTLMVNS